MKTGIASEARIVAPNVVRTGDGVDLYYRDWGTGEPVLFVAGWSLPSDSWSYQMMALREQGYRVVAFDRRGHGRSTDPGRGYDFDTLAGDIAAVLEALDLSGVSLVGHSMGCNEVVRYLARHGSRRVKRVALLGTMTPYITRADDNPQGMDPAMFEFFRREQLMKDFPRWIDENMVPFVLTETLPGMKDWLRQMALGTSLHALYECNLALTTTDFRADLPRVDVPVLIIAGDLDASAPLDLTARPTASLLPHARLLVYPGAPHGMFLTHIERANADLLEFIGNNSAQSRV
jgi:pimeloyl-ACP methyl ester carboxylesterase